MHINAIENTKKTVLAEVDRKEKDPIFKPAGSLKFKKPVIDEKAQNRKKYEKIMRKVEDKDVTDYIDEMKKVKDLQKVDDNYTIKFGLLKKAAVLLTNERGVEAKELLA